MRRGGAFRAERALGRRIRRDFESPEGVNRDVEARRTPRSIDQDRRSGDGSAGRPHGVDGLLDRTTRCHDVVNDEHPLAGCQRESAAELTTGRAVAPLRVDRTHAELPRDLVGEDDPARCRTRDGVDAQGSCPDSDRGAQLLGVRGMLKDLELLEIQRRVAARREDEVPLTERTRLAEDPLDVRRCDDHHDYSARR